MNYNIFDKAEELLLKDPSELSPEECALLEREFGDMEQADQYREFLLLTRKELSPMNVNIPEPDVFIPERIKSRMREIKREKETNRGWLRTFICLLNYRVKIYQSGIAMLAVVAFMFFITNKSNNSQIIDSDTLYADSSAVHNIDRGDTVIGGR